MIHVFIVGSKGIPAKYGGFETFVENLTARKVNSDIYYHVSCMHEEEKHFVHNQADCFNVRVPMKGAKGCILHVSRVLSKIEKWKKNNRNVKSIVYILGCRIGPLLIFHAKIMHKMGIKVLVNPDGLEWKRNKWNWIEKKFLKYCERCLVCNSDLVVCDSVNIEKYIQATYPEMKRKTTYIAYGADWTLSHCPESVVDDWMLKHQIKRNHYYLIVGRFVPENNYETILREFIRSKTSKNLVIITNVENNKFYDELKLKTKFDTDNRIKFVGTVYEQQLLRKIREEAFAYIHGHEVGGTNPSLLEALASTKLNLLFDTTFNREVAGKTALFWDKTQDRLATLIEEVDNMEFNLQLQYGVRAKERIKQKYSWNMVILQYEKLFSNIVT